MSSTTPHPAGAEFETQAHSMLKGIRSPNRSPHRRDAQFPPSAQWLWAGPRCRSCHHCRSSGQGSQKVVRKWTRSKQLGYLRISRFKPIVVYMGDFFDSNILIVLIAPKSIFMFVRSGFLPVLSICCVFGCFLFQIPHICKAGKQTPELWIPREKISATFLLKYRDDRFH